jgi:hypothetical protein
MATTTNYGWTTPDDTSLVKDGASAIRTLGSSIDTSLNNALGTKKAGLVLLNTTSFSAVASQSVNSVFNATYNNYRILVALTSSSASDTVYLRLRASGTDDTSGNYNRTLVESNSGGVTNRYDSGATSIDATVTHSPSANGGGFSFDLERPFLTQWAVGFLNSAGRGSTGNWVGRAGGFIHSSASSYDGFTIFTGSGTITGSVSVYGYNL